MAKGGGGGESAYVVAFSLDGASSRPRGVLLVALSSANVRESVRTVRCKCGRRRLRSYKVPGVLVLVVLLVVLVLHLVQTGQLRLVRCNERAHLALDLAVVKHVDLRRAFAKPGNKQSQRGRRWR